MPTERQVQVADYGVDAPGIVRNMLITGLVSIAVGYFLPTLKIGDAELFLGDIVMTSGIFIAAAGLVSLGAEVRSPRRTRANQRITQASPAMPTT